MAKSKFHPSKLSGQLQLAAFFSTTLILQSHELSTFLMDKELVSWVDSEALKEVEECVYPFLLDKTKLWNPFLAPFRVLFGRQADAGVEFALETSNTSSSPNRPSAKRTRRAAEH